MELDLQKISDEENDLIKRAHSDYGEPYKNALQSVTLFYNFGEPTEINDAYNAFLPLARKSILLALLSILRKHDIQCQLMMRQFLEASVLAAYALNNKRLQSFGHITEEGLLEINETAKDNAYKWLNEDYGEISKKIKHMKDAINSLASHANLVSATHSASDLYSIYDIEAVHVIKQRLWWIGNVIIGVLDLLKKVNMKNGGVEIVQGFEDQYRNLSAQNENIKQQLIQHPRFARYLNVSDSSGRDR